jgi:inner membrane protein
MATLLTHGMVGAVLARNPQADARLRRRLLLTAAACAMLPDIDVIWFRLGVPYGSLWGHRGMTHSLIFAATAGAVAACFLVKKGSERLRVGLMLFVITASHGLLDALTDGGLGVAFFSPFDRTRYFLPWTPISVSPIGLTRIFSSRGLQVVWTEIIWVWLPMIVVAFLLNRYRGTGTSQVETGEAKSRSTAAGR